MFFQILSFLSETHASTNIHMLPHTQTWSSSYEYKYTYMHRALFSNAFYRFEPALIITAWNNSKRGRKKRSRRWDWLGGSDIHPQFPNISLGDTAIKKCSVGLIARHSYTYTFFAPCAPIAERRVRTKWLFFFYCRIRDIKIMFLCFLWDTWTLRFPIVNSTSIPEKETFPRERPLQAHLVPCRFHLAAEAKSTSVFDLIGDVFHSLSPVLSPGLRVILLTIIIIIPVSKTSASQQSYRASNGSNNDHRSTHGCCSS